MSPTSPTIETKSLNISSRYIPDWGAWEVLREIYCNALDACANPELTKLGPDLVNVFTPTVPEISQLRIIGAGTKGADTDDIGQFGEGFKMAAMACLRAGGNLEALSPDWKITFGFENDDGEEVLHCYIERGASKLPAGFNVSIQMLGVGELSTTRFIDRNETRIHKGAHGSPLTVYVKGVWITQLPNTPSLWDWNLNNLPLNRDRNLAHTWAIQGNIATTLGRLEGGLSCEDWVKLLSGDSIEADSVLARPNLFIPKYSKDVLEAVKEIYGEKCCLASQDSHRVNQIAVAKGYTLIAWDNYRTRFLEMAGVPKAKDVIPKTSARKEISIQAPWRPRIAQTRKLLEFLGIPAIFVPFEWRNGADEGENLMAITSSMSGEARIWIHRDVFDTYTDTEYFSTIIHALSISNTPSLQAESITVELTTSRIAAELAVKQFCGQGPDEQGEEEEAMLPS